MKINIMLNENFEKCWDKRVSDHHSQVNYSLDKESKLDKKFKEINNEKNIPTKKKQICNLLRNTDFRKNWIDDIKSGLYLKKDNPTTKEEINDCIEIFKKLC